MMDMTPPEQLAEFLPAHGWHGCAVSPVAGDASFRRYFRVIDGDGRKAILMHAPPPHENPKPFADMTQYLRQHGFRAPEIFGADMVQGLLLIEDFGDVQMRMHLDDAPHEEHAVYKNAIATLAALSDAPVADIAPYDQAAYLREVQLLSEWYLPAMGLSFDQSHYDQLWNEALAPICGPEWQRVTVLRDYHAENIMLLENGGQGLIDYQDALAGHPAYDLVSILQDARRDVAPGTEAAMVAHYKSLVQTHADFDWHYALLGAQRNTKIIGIFTRLWQRDGKARYLDFLPRMWGLLERDLAHPALSPLKNWFDAAIPAAVRRQSPLDI